MDQRDSFGSGMGAPGSLPLVAMGVSGTVLYWMPQETR
jgi:hypothetical protein